MIRRWLKRFLWLTLIFLVLISAAAWAVMYSRGGAQWAIDRLVAISDTGVTYSTVNGSLMGGLEIAGLEYRDDARKVDIEGLQLEIRWSALFTRKLVLEKIRIRSITHTETGPGSDNGSLDIELPQWPFILCIGDLKADTLHSGEGDGLLLFEAVTVTDACLNGNDHHLILARAGLETLGIDLEARQLEADVRGLVPLSADLSWVYQEQGWSGTGPVTGTLELLELNKQVSGPYSFAVTGTIAPFAGEAPLLDFMANWQEWQIDDIYLRSGQAQLTGMLEDYTVSYQFDAEVPDVPALAVTGTGQGHLQGLNTLDATAQSAIGKVRYQGFLDWADTIRSGGDLTITGFDPAWLNEGLSGSLDGTATLTLDEGKDARFDDLVVRGPLNGNTLDLRGAVQAGPELIRCFSCKLLAGGNEVLFDGSLQNQQIEADLDIRAPVLSSLWPGLGGRINAQGSLSGALTSPIFKGRAGGTDLEYAGWTLARLNINSGSVSEQEIRFSLIAQDLSYEDSPPARVTADATGRLDALEVNLEWNSSWLTASLQAGLSVDGDKITGTVQSARLSELRAGQWELSKPFNFASGPDGVSAASNRWVNNESEITVDSVSLEDEATLIKASLNSWSLQNLEILLPENQHLQGTADAEVDVSFQGGIWSGSVNWRQTGTVLVAQLPGNTQAEIRVPTAEFAVQLANGGAVASAHLTIEPDVSAQLQLSADRVSTDTNINGTIVMTGSNWSWMSAVVPELDRLEGDISANLTLGGPLMAPAIKGNLDWKQGQLMIPALNILLDEVDLTLTGEPNGAASVRGTARAGDGRLELDGRFESIMTPERNAQISISGDTAELLNWPEYHVWVSPDIEILSSEEGWELRGSLALPKAEVHLRELPADAVTISEDVIVLGADEPVLRPTRYFGEAQVSLGDQVHVQLFGLDSHLSGDLLIRAPKGRPPTATGQITLVGGTFEAYGQKLQIEQGTLLFTGPMDNPVVDVKATRVIETFDGPVTAGIHLQGRALSLSSKVYSVPAMAEADALSYLVIGRPLNQVSDSEGADVSNAAIALGLGQASRITQQIGARLGLDQLNLVGDGGEGTALVAGKQVNKRLYARYAYGVFSRLGTLLLRYKLSRRVAIEATSGERQSLDILYTVEKK